MLEDDNKALSYVLDVYEKIGYHLCHAGRSEDSATYYMRASALCEKSMLYSDLVRFLERTVDCDQGKRVAALALLLTFVNAYYF